MFTRKQFDNKFANVLNTENASSGGEGYGWKEYTEETMDLNEMRQSGLYKCKNTVTFTNGPKTTSNTEILNSIVYYSPLLEVHAIDSIFSDGTYTEVIMQILTLVTEVNVQRWTRFYRNEYWRNWVTEITSSANIPVASLNDIGGIKLDVSSTSTLYLNNNTLEVRPASETTFGTVKLSKSFGINSDNKLSLNIARIGSAYAGGIKLSNDSGLIVDNSGILSLKKADVNTVGGVKIGSGLSIDNYGLLSVAEETPIRTIQCAIELKPYKIVEQTDATFETEFNLYYDYVGKYLFYHYHDSSYPMHYNYPELKINNIIPERYKIDENGDVTTDSIFEFYLVEKRLLDDAEQNSNTFNFDEFVNYRITQFNTWYTINNKVIGDSDYPLYLVVRALNKIDNPYINNYYNLTDVGVCFTIKSELM